MKSLVGGLRERKREREGEGLERVGEKEDREVVEEEEKRVSAQFTKRGRQRLGRPTGSNKEDGQRKNLRGK